MVPVAVGQHHPVDAAHVEAEPLDVALEDLVVRARVEEQRARGVAAPGGDGAGEAVGRAAHALARPQPESAAGQAGKLVLDEAGNGGEVVGGVVDEDQDFDAVDGGEIVHGGREGAERLS